MPPIGQNTLYVLPASQDITWQRNTPFPALGDISISSNSNSALVSFTITCENTSVQWIALDGHVDPDFNSVTLDNTGNAVVTPVLQNLDALTGNFYVAKIKFRTGTVERTHTVNLTIAGEFTTIKTEKPNYNVVFNRITNTLSGDSTVNILNNTAPETLSFETSGTLFLEKTLTDAFTLAEDPAYPFATSAELPATGTKIVSCRLKNAVGNTLYIFSVTVNVVNTNDISSDPEVVSLAVYSHLAETKEMEVQIINPANLAFTVSAPDFVDIDQVAGNSTITLKITTKNSSTLLPKEYTGKITVTYGAKTLDIPVTVKNISFIDLQVSDYNFCLDNFQLTVKRISDAARFVKISLEIFISTKKETYQVSPSYQIAYFNGSATSDIGKKIHQYFPVYDGHLFDQESQVDFNNQLIYKAAKVNIKIEELDANYLVVFTKSINDLKMFPGKKPRMFPMFTNSVLRRRYENTSYIFSYLTNLVSPADITQTSVSNNPFLSDQVQSVLFSDADQLMEFGNYKNILSLEFLKFPKGHLQVFVQFINQNLVPEMAVFNGFYKIEDDFTHTYDDFEINPRKYDTKTVRKMTLNTGFILKEETSMIEEIARSPLAHVKAGNEVYRCLPIPAKITPVNTEDNLVSFELEFLIVNK